MIYQHPLACGTGRLTSRLIQRKHRVLGVDNSLDMLHQARGRLPDADLVAGDLHRLPLPNDLADLVVTGLVGMGVCRSFRKSAILG